MSRLKLFLQLTKVDVEKREVHGRATQEIMDKSGEVFDYETSKPNFEKWSSEIEKATDGKSLGNVRAMHGKVAAGKLTAIEFNDSEKAIDVVAKIIDDAEWEKCAEGVYTGFSIGGSYARKWTDEDGKKRFTADPSEISIVDNPCVPTAHFAMVKADGVVEEVLFAPHVPTLTDLKKGMNGVACFASLLQSLCWLACDAAYEAESEGDSSPVPSRLAAWVKEGAAILQEMTAEETAELIAGLPSAPVTVEGMEIAAKAWDSTGLYKVGAKYSKATKDALAAAHKLIKEAETHMAGMGYEKDDDGGKAAEGDLQKLVIEKDEALAKASNDLAKAVAENAALSTEVERLKALPTPAKGVVNALGKASDNATTETDDVDELRKKIEAMPEGMEKVQALVKLALRAPAA